MAAPAGRLRSGTTVSETSPSSGERARDPLRGRVSELL